MKNLAIVLITILSVMIITPSAHTQSVGGSGSGGGGLRGTVFRSGGCIEGRRSIFTEHDSGGDSSKTVIRECRNGSYYDLSDYIYEPKARCQEGRKQFFSVDNSDSKSAGQVLHTCIKGKWLPDRR